MTLSIMNKLAVPGSDGVSGPGLLFPKLAYRFRVNFNKFGKGIATELTRQVVSVGRPQVQFPEITLPIYNSTVYIAGKPTWQALQLVLRDDASGTVQGLVGEQIQKQFDFTEQASASASSEYKFDMSIDMLDGGNNGATPTVLEQWNVGGCYIADANYGEMNYGTNEALQITLSIRFDNAVQALSGGEGFQAGIGQAVGRAAAQASVYGSAGA